MSEPELIANKYRVLKTLGQGAMGEVYLVLPPRGDPVALKLLKNIADEKNQKSAIEQFENEFKVLKKLSHPNIARIYDYGYDPELKRVYFTSPWLKGSDLYVSTKGASVETIEDYLVQTLRALNYLHQKGIIHCDLKPGNVFVENGQVQLIDFGLAGYWGKAIAGTPTYLAPEIYKGAHHSVASDLYAVGVMFYNCLARSQPFAGKDIQEIYARHKTHTPGPISDSHPEVPKYLSDIALTLLSKKAEQRPASAAAVIDDLSAFSTAKYSVETAETLLSYLPTTGELIGRREAQRRLEEAVGGFLAEKPLKPFTAIYIHGEPGVGKSKFITQVKTRLQLEKIVVEEALLPVTENDRRVLMAAGAIILEDLDQELPGGKPGEALTQFVSFLEQKVLAPDTTRFLFLLSGQKKEDWQVFEKIFPTEDLRFESLTLTNFAEEETRQFLETVIGQKEIPDKFVTEIHRNSGGNPGICQQVVEGMIAQGLLFDESGRWSPELLNNLESALSKLAPPKSLEEKIIAEYEGLSPEEKEIVSWIAMEPAGLNPKQLAELVLTPDLDKKLDRLLQNKILREEEKRLLLYRSAFATFLHQKLPNLNLIARHARLAQDDLKFSQRQVWYHQSLSGQTEAAKEALEKLGEMLTASGDKVSALECYERLYTNFFASPLSERVTWAIAMADILIWLDRFAEATHLLFAVEQKITKNEPLVPVNLRLTVWEKRGLSLLHQQKIKEASSYFAEGLRLAQQKKETRVEEIRFLNDLAQIAVITGNPQNAIKRFSESREKAKALSRKESSRITNNDLGHVYYSIREFEKAAELLREDVKTFSTLPVKEPLARALYTLAECYRGLKDFEKAVENYQECVEICQKENLLPILLRAYNGLGNTLLVNDELDEALECYQRAINISVHLKDPVTRAALLMNQGLIYRHNKNWPQASRRFLMVRQILESQEKRLAYQNQLLNKSYQELSTIAREEQDPMKALGFQLERVKLVEEADTLKNQVFEVRYDLAKLFLDNRLEDRFQAEMANLKNLAHSAEEKQKLDDLQKDWDNVQAFKQDMTVESSLNEVKE